MEQEIERKFQMDGFPKGLICLRQADIRQGYLSVEPEIRIHKAIDHASGKTDYRLTVKGNGTLSRTEIKTDVEKQFYEKTVQFLGLPMIKKDYRAYELDGYILEVCLVDAGTPWEFCYGEIEFKNEEEAYAFSPKPWFGREITDDSSCKMKNYWKRTRLEN